MFAIAVQVMAYLCLPPLVGCLPLRLKLDGLDAALGAKRLESGEMTAQRDEC